MGVRVGHEVPRRGIAPEGFGLVVAEDDSAGDGREPNEDVGLLAASANKPAAVTSASNHSLLTRCCVQGHNLKMLHVRLVAIPLIAAAVMAPASCDPDGGSALERPADPVVLTGDLLPRVRGLAPDDVVAFRYSDDAWTQIPVQVDERHTINLYETFKDVMKVKGPEPLLDTLVFSDPNTLIGEDPNPNVDVDDEIVFMADDAGGQAPAGSEPGGVKADSGFEFTVTDPADAGDVGYVYLFVQEGGLDPSAGLDYVDYDFELVNGGTNPFDYNFSTPDDPNYSAIGDPPENPTPGLNPENSRVQTSAYSTAFQDRWINDELRITADGATGVDILDRDQQFLVYGGDPNHGICGRTENTFAAGMGAMFTNVDGPVRAIREYMGANSGRYTSKRHVFYERRQDVTTFLRLHPAYGPDNVHDYDEDAIGMTYRNNLNLDGVTIDGQPDDVAVGAMTWEQVSGEQGTYTIVWGGTISVVDPPGADAPPPATDPVSFYVDDLTPDDVQSDEIVWSVQCTGDEKALGTSGQVVEGGIENTDPTRDRRPLYSVTAERVQFYDGPKQGVAEAEQRDQWVREPLTVTFTSFE